MAARRSARIFDFDAEAGVRDGLADGPEATQSCNSRDGKIIPSVDIRDVLGGRAGENTSNVP